MAGLRRRLNTEALMPACSELAWLRRELSCAYAAFNSTTDPQLLEASILEISALRARYSCALKNIKKLTEKQNK